MIPAIVLTTLIAIHPSLPEKGNLDFAVSHQIIGLDIYELTKLYGTPIVRSDDSIDYRIGKCVIDYQISKSGVTGYNIDLEPGCTVTIEGHGISETTAFADIADLHHDNYQATCPTSCDRGEDATIAAETGASLIDDKFRYTFVAEDDKSMTARDRWALSYQASHPNDKDSLNLGDAPDELKPVLRLLHVTWLSMNSRGSVETEKSVVKPAIERTKLLHSKGRITRKVAPRIAATIRRARMRSDR